MKFSLLVRTGKLCLSYPPGSIGRPGRVIPGRSRAPETCPKRAAEVRGQSERSLLQDESPWGFRTSLRGVSSRRRPSGRGYRCRDLSGPRDGARRLSS